jgi:hypothetical protein
MSLVSSMFPKTGASTNFYRLDGVYNLGILSTVEASVTVLCTALIASKPAMAALLPQSWRERIDSYLSARSSKGPNSWRPHMVKGIQEPNLNSDSLRPVKTESSSGKSGAKTPSSGVQQLDFLTKAENQV